MVVTATTRTLAACGDSGGSGGGDAGVAGDAGNTGGDVMVDGGVDRDAKDVFFHGVASGDPRPDSVILWTRVDPQNAPEAPADIPVLVEVDTDPSFPAPIVSKSVTVNADADYTLRLKVDGLTAYTTYYYRFTALGARTANGRTKTAPAPDQDVTVKLAFASCQDFNGRYYHAWKWLAAQDATNPVDFVLFLGDYIYETDVDPRFQQAAEGRAVTLPDGLVINDAGTKAALTLKDYRSLYKTYRSDPDLQAVHALYPFVAIWDDHEFADDSWQDHATHFNELKGDEASPDRRQAADRAWYEYMPADPEYHAGAAYPGDIKIYRTLRFGKNVELFLTDERYYRADHLIPEGPANMDVAKFEENTSVGARNFVLKSGFDPLEAAAKPSILGADQKAWLVAAISGSTATWKLWGSSTQMGQMLLDLSPFETVPAQYRQNFYFSVDQWDGYRSERAEILGALADAGVNNLVALSGDVHAFFVSELQRDFDAPGEPVGVEYVCAAISSGSSKEMTRTTVENNTVLNALGLVALVDQMDDILRTANPHYKFTNAAGNGLGLVTVAADRVDVQLVQVGDVTQSAEPAAPTIAAFVTRTGTNRVEVVA